MPTLYDEQREGSRYCVSYTKCLLCHGCRSYSANMVKCNKCSMNPKMICKHKEEEIIRGFEVMYKDQRPSLTLSR